MMPGRSNFTGGPRVAGSEKSLQYTELIFSMCELISKRCVRAIDLEKTYVALLVVAQAAEIHDITIILMIKNKMSCLDSINIVVRQNFLL